MMVRKTISFPYINNEFFYIGQNQHRRLSDGQNHRPYYGLSPSIFEGTKNDHPQKEDGLFYVLLSRHIFDRKNF